MGLDSVELVLEVEETFGIHIEDQEAERALTVGDLHRLVVDKLAPMDPDRCLTSAAFFRTRRALVGALGVSRREVRPSTSLAAILPRAGRRRTWQRTQAELGLRLPALEHPRWLQLALSVVGIVLAVAIGLGSGASLRWLPLLVLLGLFGYLPLVLLTRPFATAFPNRGATVGDLARDVLALQPAQLTIGGRSWSERDAWSTLCRLIVRQTGAAPERIRPETRFVADLGMD